jgi:hypothetical protein
MSPMLAPLIDRDRLSRLPAACRTSCAAIVWSLSLSSSLARLIAWANASRCSVTASLPPST